MKLLYILSNWIWCILQKLLSIWHTWRILLSRILINSKWAAEWQLHIRFPGFLLSQTQLFTVSYFSSHFRHLWKMRQCNCRCQKQTLDQFVLQLSLQLNCDLWIFLIHGRLWYTDSLIWIWMTVSKHLSCHTNKEEIALYTIVLQFLNKQIKHILKININQKQLRK